MQTKELYLEYLEEEIGQGEGRYIYPTPAYKG
jgi:hypothetical protein